MCLFGIALKINEQFPFIFAGNRDELKMRPTANAHFWSPENKILAGRDIEKGGTWLGITKTGKFAALTNVRQFPQEKRLYRSRGELVGNYLQLGDVYWMEKTDLSEYDGFNFMYGTIDELLLMSNRSEKKVKITEGIYAVSNGILTTAWPKVETLKKGMEQVASMTNCEGIVTNLFSLLRNESPFPDEELPDTGVGLALERVLSPIFIPGKEYGTRSSTVILVDKDKNCYFVEKTYDPFEQKRAFYFKLE